MPETLLLKNVRPWGDATVDVLVEDGVFTRFEQDLAPPSLETVVEDGEDGILLPGLVEGHTHMDNGPERPAEARAARAGTRLDSRGSRRRDRL